MNISQKIKFSIVKRQIEKRKDLHPFDYHYAETYENSADADPMQNNSYYFSLHDQKGKSILFRLAKRADREEVWFVCHDVDGKSYYNCDLLANDRTKASVECLTVGERWLFSFSGPVRELGKADAEPIEASLDAIFESTADIYDFSRHSDSVATARALSREKLSREFLHELSENMQTHYEQPGKANGTVAIGGDKSVFELRGMRDHSFGKRDWNYMDRHIWLTALLDNGAVMNVNMVRYPAVFELQHGYYEHDGSYVNVRAATAMDALTLSAKTPDKLNCQVELADGRHIVLRCEKEAEVAYTFDNGAYTIFEGIGRFEIDGVKGRGIIEIGYNGNRGRWTR